MKKHWVGIIGYGWAASAHIAAIRAGKHVILEKPMAMTLAECREMPLTSLRESLITFDAVFAADRSAAEGGRPVTIAELG